MARIRGQIRIGAPVEQVFDSMADSRNEPSFNPDMRSVELLTPPIEPSTWVRAVRGDSGLSMVATLTEVCGVIVGRVERRIWSGRNRHLERRVAHPLG